MSTMYDNITGRSPIATDDLGYIGTGKKASQILTEGTTDYNALDNKPTINNIELKGNKTSSDLGLQPAIDSTHKLSPNNISFTTAQSNALASGVTAETVEQVATNQTNILTVNGAVVGKNRATINSGTFTATSDTRYINIPTKGITGNITLSFGTLTTTHSGANLAITLKDASNNTIASTAINPINTLHIAVTADTEVRNINIYPAGDWGSTTVGDTLTFSDFMVCTTTEYTADSNYTPYAPSNAELYAMIQALQS